MALPNGDLITTVFDPQMAYPVDKRMQVDTLNSRDSMSMFIRWEGMEVYVLENKTKYILQGGRSNEFWKEQGTGSGTGGTTFVGQFATADLLPTSGRSAGDYAFVGTGDDFVQYNWDNIANEWVMAEGQTDMASEFFHIGYKTPLRRPVIFPLLPKDVLVQESGDFVFAPETAVARFIFTGEVTAIRGIETAEADREIKLVNRTGSDIPLRDKASGIPSGSGMDFGGTDYTWVNGSEITLKGNGTYWELAPNNQVAFSDHLDSVNAEVSVGSDGLRVITEVNDTFTGEIVSFKEIDYTPSIIDGNVFTKFNNINFKRVVKSINYAMFGAKGDGINDDAVQIKLAHQVANLLNLPVINEEGEYWLINPNGIEIQTNVSWGKTIFHVDESKNNGPRFLVKRSKEPVTITLTSGQKSSIISKINSNADAIAELSAYSNHFIKIIDENDRVGRRNGVGNGLPKTEFFALCDGGRVLNTNYWKFTDYTLLQAYFTEDKFISVQGGEFVLNGLPNPNLGSVYVSNGFSINRSKTIIRDQVVRYASGGDVTTQYLNGFYTFTHTHDTLLENITAPPRKLASAGSYGLGGGNTTLNCTFRNVTSEGGEEYASSVGTNNMKDFVVDNCTFNRVDVHFNAQNLTILRSRLGYSGVQVTGSGKLLIEDTSVKNEFFVTFRNDYGGTWDGDIEIRRSKLSLYRDRFATILQFFTREDDMYMPIAVGKRIILENIEVDYESFPASTNTFRPINFGSVSQNINGERFGFPEYVFVKDIFITGRSKKAQVLALPSQLGGFKCFEEGQQEPDIFNHNSKLEFVNIQADPSDAILVSDPVTYIDDFSPIIDLKVASSAFVKLKPSNLKSRICIEDSEIQEFDLTTHQGETIFRDCDIRPIKPTGSQLTMLAPANNPNIIYINCKWHLPIWQGTVQTGVAQINEMYGNTINLNSYVKGTHIVSKLSDGLLSTFTPRIEFLDMLKGHFRSDYENVYFKYGSTAQRPSSPPYTGFLFFDTTLGYNVYWNGSSWQLPRLVRNDGANLTLTNGSQLTGAAVNGAITNLSITDGSGTSNGYPSNYGSLVNYNGSSLQRTWSLWKNVLGNGLWVQYYDSSGVGQGWTQIGGATTFTALTDTPANYTGHKNKSVKVNNEETALVFVADGVDVRNITDGGSIAPTLTDGFIGSRLNFTSSTAVTLQGFTSAGGQSSVTLVNPHATNNLTLVHNGAGTVKYIDAGSTDLVIAPKTAVKLEIVGNEIYRVL